jgi:hypothetical protein
MKLPLPAPWTTPADLRAQVSRLWDKGRLLAPLAGAQDPFPLRLALKVPGSAEWSDRFDEVRSWARGLQLGAKAGDGPGYRLVLREVRHRVLGSNALPAEAWLDTLDDALALIGKQRAARHFAALAAHTSDAQPALLPWLQAQPLRALDLADEWPRLLDVVQWLAANPRPGIYLRQIDLPDIHSKFIEAHRGVLAELLDLALPAQAIDSSAGGLAQFARRYGLRSKPVRVRFRMLDAAQALLATGTDQDLTVTHDTFARLDPAASRVFITENETNFLAFPALPDSLVIFGAGYGFDMLAQAPWLQQRSVHYWGDIDTHGFAILDQLRNHLPHARSFLMDRDTLLAHQPQWSDEPEPSLRDLPRLTDAERAVHDDLRWNRLGDRQVRLEQERIGFGWVARALQAL